MKQQLIGSGFVAGVVLGVSMLLPAPAQDGQTGVPAAVTAPGAGQDDPAKLARTAGKADAGKLELSANRALNYSAGVDEILKMVQSGVSTQVIKAYIEDSPVAYNLTAADLIALKEQAFPDELTLAMMKRGAALRMQARQAMASAATPASAGGGNRRYYRLDPESYDYFQYYYLYPRTLAAANQRFFSANGLAPGFGPYAYGYYGPPPFWPLPPS